MNFATVEKLLDTMKGSTFMGLDTVTDVKLKGGKGNPQQGRVQKVMVGATVQLFENRKSSAYGDMVQRRLEKEGKNPEDFQLQPRKWGERIAGTPFVRHEKDGVLNHYLEVIFVRAGQTHYLLDGKPVDKADIVGLPERKEAEQGGLEDKVVLRDFKVSSITAIRIDGNEYK